MMSVINTPFHAAAQQPDPPCEQYKCRKYEACAQDKLACRAFDRYVNQAKVIDPEHWWNRRGRSEPDASRELFDKIYADDD